ncbi:urea ABC transporter ATP-binding subunit UrtE [Bradyrhizobium liaoningense]|uniref:urea ABC transporter ATP-binding subunit UrtE n=1 Tax=Bradyrhizobium liaoningense TaxID=43992 RepID=UPI001BAD0BCC|nr:urea ABC transporter ATP-binding subunit UrtE [Bradyrhizobium liaoningense]
MTMRFRVESLDQHYGSAQVLRRVDFEIAPGECLAVLGRNGAGKTTLLKCLMGVLPVTRGKILVDDTDVVGWSSHRRSTAGLAYVPQGREIFSELTVGENIEAAARAHGTFGTPFMDEAIGLFPVLRQMWRRPGGSLSGGQQQQLAIARALVTKPGLLILDEPTEGIQPNLVATIRDVLATFRGRMSLLLVEQYLDFAVSLADSFVVLSRGSVTEAGRIDSTSRETLARHISI